MHELNSYIINGQLGIQNSGCSSGDVEVVAFYFYFLKPDPLCCQKQVSVLQLTLEIQEHSLIIQLPEHGAKINKYKWMELHKTCVLGYLSAL